MQPWSPVRFAILAWIVLTLGCQPSTVPEPAAVPFRDGVAEPPIEEPQNTPLRFTQIENTGIDFLYYGNPSPQHYMTEQNGGGVALADFNNDGNLDVFLVNGSHFEKPAQSPQHSNQLYFSVGNLVYIPVAAQAGLLATGFGMGCSSADFDNDGFYDLFVTYYGHNRFWKNNGDGTFTEVSKSAGVDDPRWGTSAAFADLDDDGDLDLYVVNYVEWSPEDPPCYTQHQPPIHISCGPIGRTAQTDLLYENLGNGSFRDVSVSAGIAAEHGKGLALGIADLNDDRMLDIYVANDTTANSLFLNRGNLKFEDVALELGVATSAEGKAQAGMGVGCADYNRDGRLDLCVTNFENEHNDFYENLGELGFQTRNAELGLDPASRATLAFGVVLTDFDLDAWPDLFIVTGHVWDLTSLGVGYSYAMQPLLWHNRRGERYWDAQSQAGSYFQEKRLGRAAAFGDLDNDGDTDLVVTHLQSPVALLRNDSDRTGTGVLLDLVGRKSARQPLGISIRASTGELEQRLVVPAGQSFQASNDPRVLIPVPKSTTNLHVTVEWSRDSSSVHELSTDGHVTLLEPITQR